MASFNQEILGLHAFCLVASAAPPSFIVNRGFSGLLRNGVGDYTLTLQNPVDIVNGGSMYRLTLVGNAPLASSVAFVDTTHLRVRTLDTAGNPADSPFCLEVMEVSPT